MAQWFLTPMQPSGVALSLNFCPVIDGTSMKSEQPPGWDVSSDPLLLQSPAHPALLCLVLCFITERDAICCLFCGLYYTHPFQGCLTLPRPTVHSWAHMPIPWSSTPHCCLQVGSRSLAGSWPPLCSLLPAFSILFKTQTRDVLLSLAFAISSAHYHSFPARNPSKGEHQRIQQAWKVPQDMAWYLEPVLGSLWL